MPSCLELRAWGRGICGGGSEQVQGTRGPSLHRWGSPQTRWWLNGCVVCPPWKDGVPGSPRRMATEAGFRGKAAGWTGTVWLFRPCQ